MSAIQRITRVVADLPRAQAFYQALGFRGEDGVMRLGTETLALERPERLGRPYPAGSRSNDLWFQHIAVVVRDMDAAYAHLRQHTGWVPISEGGPQTLPPENGSVRAFKFRDPDGHPVELIWFPPGQGRARWQAGTGLFLGIDHSAIAVADVAASLRFYAPLGFQEAARSWNHGPAQSRLDALPDAKVHVISLRPTTEDSMGIELLAYDPPGRAMTVGATDIAADRLTLAAAPRDPDGHRLTLA